MKSLEKILVIKQRGILGEIQLENLLKCTSPELLRWNIILIMESDNAIVRWRFYHSN